MFLNQTFLIGNLGQDPELLKETEKGCFVRLRLATNKVVISQDGEKMQSTQWHTVYVNNGVGKYMLSQAKKGMALFVQGELRTHTWKNKEGKDCYETAVYAQKCRIFHHEPVSQTVEPLAEAPAEETEEISF